MKRYLFILLLSLCALTPVKAQYYSINIDYKTAAAMAVAFNTEAATEMYYAEQIAKIRDSYEAAEVATAGIFTSKFLDRKALSDMGLWTNSIAWLSDYAREEMDQYYTQRWYIYRADKGSVSLCDYYPPTDDDAGLPIIKKAPASCGC